MARTVCNGQSGPNGQTARLSVTLVFGSVLESATETTEFAPASGIKPLGAIVVHVKSTKI